MKTSQFATLAVLATTAFALPEPQRHGWGKGKGRGKVCGKDKKDFTSTYSVVATPGQVANATADGEGFYFTGGLPGAIGYYDFGLNSDKNLLCYEIALYGFRGEYESAANTATHIHEAPYGETGPPRIAMKNPRRTGNKDERKSSGCLTGPFTVGVEDDAGVDLGAAFQVSSIEADPAGFFCDVHSSLAIPGAVRGQLG